MVTIGAGSEQLAEVGVAGNLVVTRHVRACPVHTCSVTAILTIYFLANIVTLAKQSIPSGHKLLVIGGTCTAGHNAGCSHKTCSACFVMVAVTQTSMRTLSFSVTLFIRFLQTQATVVIRQIIHNFWYCNVMSIYKCEISSLVSSNVSQLQQSIAILQQIVIPVHQPMVVVLVSPISIVVSSCTS